MCIAIHVPKGRKLNCKTIESCWSSNPHGAGFMYAHNGKIRIFKELKSPVRFYDKYTEESKKHNKTSDFVLHFRIATSGMIDENNCHPFMVNDSIAFCHNGILSIDIPKKSKLSDTRVFSKDILSKLPEDFIFNAGIRDLIAGYIEGSKMIFLHKSGKVFIINKHLGLYDSGVFYSNNSYKSNNYSWFDWEKPLFSYDKSGKVESYNDVYDSTSEECYFCGSVLLTDKEYNDKLCAYCYDNCTPEERDEIRDMF